MNQGLSKHLESPGSGHIEPSSPTADQDSFGNRNKKIRRGESEERKRERGRGRGREGRQRAAEAATPLPTLLENQRGFALLIKIRALPSIFHFAFIG